VGQKAETAMHYDRRGISITTRSAAALPHLDAAVTSFLAHRRDTPAHIEAALAEDPDLGVAHAFSGFLALLLGRAELFPVARLALQWTQASLVRRGGTAREHKLADALASWCEGEMELAADRLDEILTAHPLDALTAKLVQSLRFMLGDAKGMRRSVETILPAWSETVPGHGFVLGCHAFALEETDELGAAEQTGRQALECETQDVWGCHAVAHVYEAHGDVAPGLAWIDTHADRWAAVNNFARHMDWHRALFHVARNEAGRVLEIYDHQIRDVKTDDYRDITNAASLLYRLEASGIGVGRRWVELAGLAERRLSDRTLAFAQLHYLLCLIGAGRWGAAYQLFAAMDLEARSGHGTQARLLAELGVPLAKTMLACFGADGHAASSIAIMPRNDLARLGGSHAQRQTFERILRDAEDRQRQLSQHLATIRGDARRSSPRPSQLTTLALAR
jgi:hypothetical protein